MTFRGALGTLLIAMSLAGTEADWQTDLAFADQHDSESTEPAQEPVSTADGGTGDSPLPGDDETDGSNAPTDQEEPPRTDNGTDGETPSADGAEAPEAPVESGAADGNEPATVANAVRAVAGSVLQIVIRGRNNEVRRAGSGFVIADQTVITAAHLVDGESRITAIPLTTQAEFVVHLVESDDVVDAALLRVNGLDLPPVTFGQDGFSPGRAVVSVSALGEDADSGARVAVGGTPRAAFAEGAVGRLRQLDDLGAGFIEHNAMIPAAGYGGPLINDCGEVVGMNRGSPGVSRSRLRRGVAPEGVVLATGVAALASVFADADATFAVSGESCADARESAEAEAEEARRRADAERVEAERVREALEQERARAAENADATERVQADLEAARARVAELERAASEQEDSGTDEGARANEEALAAARSAVANLEAERIALEQQREADRRRMIVTVVIAAAVVVMVTLIALVLYQRRMRQVRTAQPESAQEDPIQSGNAWERRALGSREACVLNGTTSDGVAISLPVSADQLDAGVVIGRHPERSGIVIADTTLSREHARLSYAVTTGRPNRVQVRDLGTTNGTSVNGRELAQGEEMVLHDGDTLALGGVVLRLRQAN